MDARIKSGHDEWGDEGGKCGRLAIRVPIRPMRRYTARTMGLHPVQQF